MPTYTKKATMASSWLVSFEKDDTGVVPLPSWILRLMKEERVIPTLDGDTQCLFLNKPTGSEKVYAGEHVVLNAEGELFRCHDDEFLETFYDEVPE